MTDLTQLRKTVRVLVLMDESFRAYMAGDRLRATELMRQTTTPELLETCVLLQGGMVIGEIPSPDKEYDEWLEYLDVVRGTLDEAERRGLGEPS